MTYYRSKVWVCKTICCLRTRQYISEGSFKPADKVDYLEAEAIALMECFTVKFLHINLLTLIHVSKITGVQTLVHLTDGVVNVVSKVHHFFLQTAHITVGHYFSLLFNNSLELFRADQSHRVQIILLTYS